MRGVGVAIAVVVALAACGPARSPTAAPADVKAEADDAGAGPDASADGGASVADEDGEPEATDVATGGDRCPEGMVVVETPERSFCIDRFEASLVEVLEGGAEQPYPHFQPVDGHAVRAVSVPGVMPQGFVSEVQAADACAASGKRLCAYPEWKTACMGPAKTAFPYGDSRKPGVCHDQGKSAVLAVFGAKAVLASNAPPPPPRATAGVTRHGIAPSPSVAGGAKKPAHVTRGRAAQTVKTRPSRSGATKPGKGAAPAAKGATKKRIPGKASARPSNVDPGVWAKLNDPGLGQVEGALATSGSHEGCVNAWGVHDMVGNLHEWVATDASLPHGTFAGGYYLDTALNGDGCHYRTVAHAHDYHDYSTGFRCCRDLAAGP